MNDSSPDGSLQRYERLIREWAPRLDLVAPGDLDRIRERHIDDSLRLLPLLDEVPPGPCVDVGSGAGLPGIPLAISSGRHWSLIEPRKRRAAFLEEVVRELGLDCEVVAERVETAVADPRLRGTVALATARALAPPQRAFEMIRPLVAPGGVAAVFVGRETKLPPEAGEWAPGIAIIGGTRTLGEEG